MASSAANTTMLGVTEDMNTSFAMNSSEDDVISIAGVTDTAGCRLYVFAVSCVLQWVVMFGGILGNCLTCAVVWEDIHKSTMPFLMMNLAAADNLVLLLLCNMRAIPALCDYKGGCLTYQRLSAAISTVVWPMVSTVHMMASWSIVAITFSRFVSVCWATRANQFNSRRKVKVRILVMHACCVIFNIPRYLEAYVSYDVMGKPVSIKRQFSKKSTFNYVYKIFLYYAFYYVIPLGLLIYFTIRLCISLRHVQKRREEMTSKSRARLDLTFSLVIVVLIFIVCQLTNPIRRLLAIVYPLSSQNGCGTVYFYYTPISSLFVTFSSGINFFIFCLCGRRFRSRLKTLFWNSRVVPVTAIFTFSDATATAGKNSNKNLHGIPRLQDTST